MHFICGAKFSKFLEYQMLCLENRDLMPPISMKTQVEEARLKNYASLGILVSHGNGIRSRRIKGAIAEMKGDPTL